jgi:lathosterol oxidase
LAIGHFHHQLHHRFFDCNYGSVDMPWDKWFGTFHTFHDGNPNAMNRIRALCKL